MHSFRRSPSYVTSKLYPDCRNCKDRGIQATARAGGLPAAYGRVPDCDLKLFVQLNERRPKRLGLAAVRPPYMYHIATRSCSLNPYPAQPRVHRPLCREQVPASQHACVIFFVGLRGSVENAAAVLSLNEGARQPLNTESRNRSPILLRHTQSCNCVYPYACRRVDGPYFCVTLWPGFDSDPR